MKTNARLSKRKRGMTLLELTVVILVLLSLISILFIGARAWKKGSDRAACVITIRNVQQMIRSYQNLNDEPFGATIDVFVIANEFQLSNIGTCPGGGDYDHAGTIPPVGTLVMTCSLAGSDGHVPDDYYGW
jgi:prepilin-type N-terminal cleavage/methylation domain-containing protein